MDEDPKRYYRGEHWILSALVYRLREFYASGKGETLSINYYTEEKECLPFENVYIRKN